MKQEHRLETMQTQSLEPAAGTGPASLGGFAFVAGAVAYVIHLVARSVLTAGPTPVEAAQDALWIPVNGVGAIGALLTLAGFPIVYPRLAGEGGLRSLIGFALLEASWAFFGFFLSLYGALIQPWLADRAPSLVADSSSTPTGFTVAFAANLLAWLVGSVLLAIQYVRGESGPRWIGYLLPASALWFLIGSFVIAPDGPASNLAANLLSNLGPVLLLTGLGYIGLQLWQERRSASPPKRRHQSVKPTAGSMHRA